MKGSHDTRAAKIKAGLQAAKKRGVKLGTHGKKVLSKANRKAAEGFAKKTLPLLKEFQQEGYTTVRAITTELNKRQVPTFRGEGEKWHLRTVNLLLRRLNPQSLKPQPQPVKWVGGKRSIINELKAHLPETFNSYYEPFFGGGALFFAIHSKIKKAYLSDCNYDLMTTYQVIQQEPEDLIKRLKVHAAHHSETHYYTVRKKHKSNDPIDVAARMLYLNKTCYNGLWRVNRKGEFNAAMGDYLNPVIYHVANLKACSNALEGAKIRYMDYRKIKPKRGDFVYFDPPYHQLNATSFTAYSENNFTSKDQIRLARFCRKLHARGVKFMLSNSCTDFVYKLYHLPGFNIHVVKAARMINCEGSGRQAVEEYVITNY